MLCVIETSLSHDASLGLPPRLLTLRKNLPSIDEVAVQRNIGFSQDTADILQIISYHTFRDTVDAAGYRATETVTLTTG